MGEMYIPVFAKFPDFEGFPIGTNIFKARDTDYDGRGKVRILLQTIINIESQKSASCGF